jgi:hypothetical protein
MPRPKPPEELFPVTYRLTRNQIRKVQSAGGVVWLRKMISTIEAAKVGRDPVERLRQLAQRNRYIGMSDLPSRHLAEEYKLSIKRVQQIRRQQRA